MATLIVGVTQIQIVGVDALKIIKMGAKYLCKQEHLEMLPR